MAATNLVSNRVSDMRADSIEELWNKLSDVSMDRSSDHDCFLNRNRSFNVESKVIQKNLITASKLKQMQDLVKNWMDKNEGGSAVNISYGRIVVQIVPTVPEGYPGFTHISLIDTGLSPLSQELESQQQTVELGVGPVFVMFDLQYSVPIMDDRHIALRFVTDCEMASSKMSVMNVYAYWSQKRSLRASYYRRYNSSCTLLKVGYRKELRFKDTKAIMGFVAKSLQIEDMVNNMPNRAGVNMEVYKEPLQGKSEVFGEKQTYDKNKNASQNQSNNYNVKKQIKSKNQSTNENQKSGVSLSEISKQPSKKQAVNDEQTEKARVSDISSSDVIPKQSSVKNVIAPQERIEGTVLSTHNSALAA